MVLGDGKPLRHPVTLRVDHRIRLLNALENRHALLIRDATFAPGCLARAHYATTSATTCGHMVTSAARSLVQQDLDHSRNSEPARLQPFHDSILVKTKSGKYLLSVYGLAND